MNSAIGIVEMFGFVTAITAADAAAKAANVKIIAIDSNKPANAETVDVPLIMAIKIQGEVSAVKAAVDAGANTLEDVQAETGASTVCGACMENVQRLVDFFVKERDSKS